MTASALTDLRQASRQELSRVEAPGNTVGLVELRSALSCALKLTDSRALRHSAGSRMIGIQAARELGVAERVYADTY